MNSTSNDETFYADLYSLEDYIKIEIFVAEGVTDLYFSWDYNKDIEAEIYTTGPNSVTKAATLTEGGKDCDADRYGYSEL